MSPVKVKDLGVTNYVDVYQQMQAFTAQRSQNTVDEIWCTEHQPVFTQGQAGKSEHLLAPGDIPVIATDRGGQVTYHGPGQLVVYLMLDLRRVGIKVRGLVTGIEQAIIRTLAAYNITAAARPDAPGVYCDGNKIASLGLRVRKGYSYHGLSMNVVMNLEPFERINPCGLEGMNVVQVSELGGPTTVAEVQQDLLVALLKEYGLRPCN